jgi:hypothetical protein
MNAFEKWYEENKDHIFVHPVTRAQQGYVAGLRRAAEIVRKKSKMNSAFEEAILVEATRIEKGE